MLPALACAQYAVPLNRNSLYENVFWLDLHCFCVLKNYCFNVHFKLYQTTLNSLKSVSGKDQVVLFWPV